MNHNSKSSKSSIWSKARKLGLFFFSVSIIVKKFVLNLVSLGVEFHLRRADQIYHLTFRVVSFIISFKSEKDDKIQDYFSKK